GIHYDTHDVFVLQLKGRKHWTIYDAPVTLPLKHQKSDWIARPDSVTEDRVLAPGDLLYLPRGFLHQAVSLDESSLHLTVGVNSITWGEVILAAVQERLDSDPRFRASLPPGFAHDTESAPALVDQLGGLMRDVLESVDLRAAIADATEKAYLVQRTAQPGR